LAASGLTALSEASARGLDVSQWDRFGASDPGRRGVGKAHGKLIIGLAGGIGSGKSTVARILGECGAAVIDSDRINAEQLESPEVIDTLVAWYGPTVRDSDGRIIRSELARIVFSDQEQRRRLEELLHPRIDRRRRELIEEYARDPAVRAVVMDSPLLFEAGLDRSCDTVIFVDAPLDRRRRRVGSSRGWAEDELDHREKLQKPLDIKRSRADHIVVNNSGLNDLRTEVEELFSRLLSEASSQ